MPKDSYRARHVEYCFHAPGFGAAGSICAFMWTIGMQAGGLWTHPLTRSSASVLFLVFASAVWIETDVYRPAGGILAACGAIAWFQLGSSRPSAGWMASLCFTWVAWVAGRYALAYQFGDLQKYGSAEGIYLFPLFYSALGFALFVFRIDWREASVLFVATSLIAALATVDFAGVFAGGYHEIFDTNNRIHGSVGAGFVILAALNLLAFESRTESDPRVRWALQFLCLATISVCAIGIFGAKSKGVWAGLAIGLALQALFSVRDLMEGRRANLTGLAAAAVAVIVIAIFHKSLWDTVSPSLGGLTLLLVKAVMSGDPVGLVRETIACGGLPRGTYLRLMMWHDAVEVWSHAIVFGNGIGWNDLYLKSFYAGQEFNVVHNGYLEIAMRYGLVGLGFLFLLFGWSISMAWKACRRGLIAKEGVRFHAAAAVYFLATLATNANNRISVGESYLMAMAAFGFYCLFLMADQRRTATRDIGREQVL